MSNGFKALLPTTLTASRRVTSTASRASAYRSSAAKKPVMERRSTARPGSASAIPSRYRPPLPEIITLSCGIPLWVFPRRDLPTVAGSIVIQAGAGLQRPAQAGLAQLTTVMLDEGTTSRSAEEIALAAESMGATIDASCGWDGSYVSFRCLAANLPYDPRLDRRHPLQPDLSAGGVAAGAGPDARGPQGGTRQRRVTRVPKSFVGPL